MNYWLAKSEPSEYSYEDLKKAGRDVWDGIRNYRARNFMREMKQNDRVLFYHTQKEKAVVGIARVVKTAYPDPKAAAGEDWSVVDLAPVKALKRGVTLAEIKANKLFADSLLVRVPRLSVMPLTKAQFDWIVEKGSKAGS